MLMTVRKLRRLLRKALLVTNEARVMGVSVATFYALEGLGVGAPEAWVLRVEACPALLGSSASGYLLLPK